MLGEDRLVAGDAPADRLDLPVEALEGFAAGELRDGGLHLAHGDAVVPEAHALEDHGRLMEPVPAVAARALLGVDDSSFAIVLEKVGGNTHSPGVLADPIGLRPFSPPLSAHRASLL